MRKTAKIRLQELSLLLLSLIVSVFLAEMLARGLGVSPFETNIGRHQFDPDLGWKTRANHRTFISRRSFAHRLYYNGDGLPSGEDDLEAFASREQPSIALIGDSYVEGAYLPYEKSLAHTLDRMSAKQVLNFGVDGYGPDQYLLAARKRLEGFKVTDIVVFFFAHNDTLYLNSDSYLGYSKPLISIPEYEPVNTPLRESNSNREDRGLALSVLDEFALWSLVKPLLGFVAHGDGRKIESIKQSPQDMKQALQLIGRIHTEFPEPSFHVYYIPELSELEDNQSLDHNVGLFLQICSELALECVTASPFSQHEAKDLYIPIDRHFSELGARLVATQIYELLENQD